MVFSSRLAAQPIWWRVVGLPLLGSCQLAPQTAPTARPGRTSWLSRAIRSTSTDQTAARRSRTACGCRLPTSSVFYEELTSWAVYWPTAWHLLLTGAGLTTTGRSALYCVARGPAVIRSCMLPRTNLGACFWSLVTPTGPPTCTCPGAWAPPTRTKVTSICMIPPAG